jgi:MHS family alpha-ketoglutarate permease-like MFS transporter
MRRDMAETEQFEKNVAKAKAIKNPLMLTLREYPKSVAQLIGLTLLSTLCYYTFFSALTPFAVKGNGLDDGMVFWALSIATALICGAAIPLGWTADHFGRKPQLLVWSGAIALLMVPVSTLIRPEAGFGSVLLVFCFGLGLYAMKSSIAPAIMSELFPTRLRAWASVPGTTSPSTKAQSTWTTRWQLTKLRMSLRWCYLKEISSTGQVIWKCRLARSQFLS